MSNQLQIADALKPVIQAQPIYVLGSDTDVSALRKRLGVDSEKLIHVRNSVVFEDLDRPVVILMPKWWMYGSLTHIETYLKEACALVFHVDHGKHVTKTVQWPYDSSSPIPTRPTEPSLPNKRGLYSLSEN